MASAGSRFIQPYMRWFQRTTDAPQPFGEAGALMCLSTIALGRRWLTGTEKLHPNLFVMIVGPSSVARKSTAVKRAQLIVENVAPELVGPTDYTPEALFKRLNVKDEKGKPRSKLTLFANEYGADLARSAAYGPTMQADFCALYDCDRIEKVRVRGSVTVEKPRVNLFGAAAYEMLKQHIDPSNWSTGFMMRFLYVGPSSAPRPIFKNEPPAAPTEMQNAVASLQLLRDALTSGYGGGMVFDAAALNAFDHFSDVFDSLRDVNQHHIVQMYSERLRTTFRKLCMIYQIDIDPNADISLEAVSRAAYFLESVCWPHFIETYQITTQRDFDSVMGTLCNDLRAAGQSGLLRSDISHRFFHSRVTNDVVDWMKKARLVTVMPVNGDEKLWWRGR